MVSGVDAPIIDDFGDDGGTRGRRSSWGFDRIKRSVAKQAIKNSPSNNSAGDSLRKRSWKDISRIKDSLESIAKSIKDDIKQSPARNGKSDNEYAKRRQWFSKLQYQKQLIARLTGIEKSLKKRSGSGGLLGGIGTLASLIGGRGGGGLVNMITGKGGAGGILGTVLTALLAKSAIGKLGAGAFRLAKKGATNAVPFGRKMLNHAGTFIKSAGNSRLIAPLMGGASGLLGSLTGGANGASLSRIAAIILPKVVSRLVLGLPGAIAMVAKVIWDNVLPEKWKKYITYKVSKLYLAAIDKVASMFEWIGNKVEELKNAIQLKLATIFAKIYGTLDFIGNLLTGEGDARTRVKNYFQRIWTTLEATVKTYITGFVSTFRDAYNSFIKPFYDSKGNFSLIAGITHYAKAGYNMGANAINDASNAVDKAIDGVKGAFTDFANSNWNPANWQGNAEANVKKYELDKAKADAQAKRDEALKKTQEQNNKLVGGVDKTLQTLNSFLSSGGGLISNAYGSAMGIGNNGVWAGGVESGASTTGATANTGAGLAGLVAKAESGGKGYNAYNRGTAGDSKAPLNIENMTIGQIMTMQRQGKLFAVGKYQMVTKTLREAVEKLNINPNAKFDAKMQEHLFSNYLVAGKRPEIENYIKGNHNNLQSAQMGLAKEFASIGVPYAGSTTVGTGRNAKTYTYRKDGTFYAQGGGGNKASVTSAQSAAQLNGARAAYQKAIQEGKSPQEAWGIAVASAEGVTMSASMASPTGSMDVSGTSTPPDSAFMTMLKNLRNPLAAKKMYDEAKGSATATASNVNAKGIATGIARAEVGDVSYPNILEEFEGANAKVNTMGAFTTNGIYRPNPAVERQKAKAKNPTNNNVSTTSGSSASDFFSRPNLSNVNHENAFPS